MGLGYIFLQLNGKKGERVVETILCIWWVTGSCAITTFHIDIFCGIYFANFNIPSDWMF